MNEEVRTGRPGAEDTCGAEPPIGSLPAPQALLSALLRTVDLGVVLLDATRRVTATNQAFVALGNLGVPPEKLIGMALPCGPASYAHLYARPDAVRQWADRIIERGVPASDQFEAADGGTLRCGYRPVCSDGRTIGHCWTIRRTDERGPDEQRADERGPGDQGADEQGAGDPDRAGFASAVAHEVRTPATSVAALTGMLDDPDLDPESRTRITEAVRRNAERMQLLASDLFRLAELDRCRARGHAAEDLDAPAPVDIPTAVERATAELDHPVEITVLDPGPGVPADARLLEEALTTVSWILAGLTGDAIMTVAARHSAEGWTVEFGGAVDGQVTTEQLLALRVRHPSDAQAGQTAALGLIMARAAVTSLGGWLTARSVPGSAGTVPDVTELAGQPGWRYVITLGLPPR